MSETLAVTSGDAAIELPGSALSVAAETTVADIPTVSPANLATTKEGGGERRNWLGHVVLQPVAFTDTVDLTKNFEPLTLPQAIRPRELNAMNNAMDLARTIQLVVISVLTQTDITDPGPQFHPEDAIV